MKPPRKTFLWNHIALALLYLAMSSGMSAQDPPFQKSLSKDDVVRLLAGNVSVKRVTGLARQRSIDFQVTAEIEKELLQAGADEALLSTLKQLESNTLTFPGHWGCDNTGWQYTGTLTIGGNNLRFHVTSPTGGRSWGTPLSNVSRESYDMTHIGFYVWFTGGGQYCGFWVDFGEHKENANIEGAEQLFRVMKAASK